MTLWPHTMLFFVAYVTNTNSVPVGAPKWPTAFTVKFTEFAHLKFVNLFNNSGAWFYDFAQKQARFDHGRGQKDWFCSNQHLSDNDKHAPCSLLFSNDRNLYIHYPEAKTCCILCGQDQYCTVVKPTWLQNGTYFGDETIDGVNCHGWKTPGAKFMDMWYVSDDNIPCRYYEKSDVLGTEHNVTFDRKTFLSGQQNEDVFAVPSYCHKKCPHPYPPKI